MCPDRKTLLDWLTGQLAAEQLEEIYAHVESCSQCQSAIIGLDEADSLLDDLGNLQEIVKLPTLCERMLLKSQSKFAQRLTASQDQQTTRLPNDRIRDYILCELLGMGGMGAVYRARHERLGREVAIKVLSPRQVNSRTAIERFNREMSAIGKLSHPNIVSALDAGCENGIHYLVMEYLDGFNGRQLVERLGPLPFSAAAKIVLLISEGLQHAHQQGFVHRDMKPSNFMVTDEGSLKVLDLGLSLWRDAKTSGISDSLVVGTLDYMAPEQMTDSEQVDQRADIYSLGNTWHFLLYGYPARIDHARDIQPEEGSRGEPSVELPPELRALLKQMLAEPAEERPSYLAEVTAQLAPWTTDGDLHSLITQARQVEPETATSTPPLIPSAWLEPSKNGLQLLPQRLLQLRSVIVLGAALLCSLGLGIGWNSWGTKNQVKHEDRVKPTERTSLPKGEADTRQANTQKKETHPRRIVSTSKGPFPDTWLRFKIPDDFRGEQETL